MSDNKGVNHKPVYIAAIVLAIVVGIVIVTVFGIGRLYQNRLSFVDDELPREELVLLEKPDIRRITIRQPVKNECIEVTPDGVVRVYQTCGGELDSANRPTDPRNILKLFRQLSEQDWSKFMSKGNGDVYELTIETDTGTQVLYIPVGQDNPASTVIIDTIHDIEEDIPVASPPLPPTSPGAPQPTPSVSPRVSVFPGSSPLPSSTPGTSTGGNQGFACDFNDGGTGPKPYRVSNVVCTTDPSPLP